MLTSAQVILYLRASPSRCSLRIPSPCGANEKTNGLLRQYLLKGTDLPGDIQREPNTIVHLLNTGPGKYLHWATPLEAFTQRHHQSPVPLGT